MTECSASRAINKPLSQSFGPAFVYFVPKTVSAGAGHLISPSDPQQGPYQLGHVRVIIQSILLIKEQGEKKQSTSAEGRQSLV